MSNYLQQEYDFIERTKKILIQYDSFKEEEKEKYEVTLLLNSFVGLLILPQQYWYDYLPETTLTEKDWGIDPENVIFMKKQEVKNVKNFSRHLRNSISHYNFFAFSDDDKIISHIKFIDSDSSSNTFEAILPVKNIRNFLNILSDFMLKTMGKSK